MSEMQERNAQPENDIQCPWMQPPMKVAEIDRLARRFVRQGVGCRWGMEMVQWLGHSPENQPHPHACCKQHGQPCESAILRLFILFSKPEPPIRTHHKPQYKHDKARGSQDVISAERFRDKRQGCLENLARRFGPETGKQDEGYVESRSGKEHRWVHPITPFTE